MAGTHHGAEAPPGGQPALSPLPIDLSGYQLAMEDEVFTVTAGQVDLWLIRSPRGAGGEALDSSELDEAEQRRADSFVRPDDGLLYTTAHVALRRLLARYAGIPPRELRFVREPCPGCGAAHGRPALKGPAAPLHFSLSHSDGMALVGIAVVPIGVDTERLPSWETVEDCSQELHPAERGELAAAGVEEQKVRFGQIWTRKEAFLKGIGTGLSRSLSQDYLGADVERHPRGWFLSEREQRLSLFFNPSTVVGR